MQQVFRYLRSAGGENQRGHSDDEQERSSSSRQERQFVCKVLRFSSQYGRSNGSAYVVCNLIGENSIYPEYGDFARGSAFRTYGRYWSNLSSSEYRKFGRSQVVSEDFVDLYYEKAVVAKELHIYETYNPGSVVRILSLERDSNCWHVLWKGLPAAAPAESRILRLPLKCSLDFMTNVVRVEFNHSSSNYYSEIDAVALVGVDEREDGCGAQHKKHASLASSTRSLEITHDKDYIGNLPTEILQLIISYVDVISLCRLAQASRKFCTLCRDPQHWLHVNLQPFAENVDDSALKELGKKCSRLRKLNLSWVGDLDGSLFADFLRKCGLLLSTLVLQSCPFVRNVHLETFSTSCPSLQCLDLANCTEVSDFERISSLTRLLYLSLYHCRIEEKDVLCIVEKCRRIEHLNLGSCSDVSNFDSIAVAIGLHLCNLVSLDLWRASPLTLQDLIVVAKGCSRLEELDVGWCRPISGSLQQLAKYLPNLKKLFVPCVRLDITDDDVYAVIRHCPALSQLDIMGALDVTEQSVLQLLRQCEHLRLLDVSFCKGIEFATVMEWRRKFPTVDIKKSFQT